MAWQHLKNTESQQNQIGTEQDFNNYKMVMTYYKHAPAPSVGDHVVISPKITNGNPYTLQFGRILTIEYVNKFNVSRLTISIERSLEVNIPKFSIIEDDKKGNKRFIKIISQYRNFQRITLKY